MRVLRMSAHLFEDDKGTRRVAGFRSWVLKPAEPHRRTVTLDRTGSVEGSHGGKLPSGGGPEQLCSQWHLGLLWPHTSRAFLWLWTVISIPGKLDTLVKTWQLICGAAASKNGVESSPKFCGTRGGRKADADDRIPNNVFVGPLISASLCCMSASCCGSRGDSSCTYTHCVAWLSILDKESASVLVVPCLYIILNLYSCNANVHLKSRPGG